MLHLVGMYMISITKMHGPMNIKNEYEASNLGYQECRDHSKG